MSTRAISRWKAGQKLRILAAVLGLCLALVVPAGATEDLSDHPLVQPYERSVLRSREVREAGDYRAFNGIDGRTGELSGLPLQGRVTRLFYDRPRDRSTVEIYRHYERSLVDSGAQILFRCDQAERAGCLKARSTNDLQKLSGLRALSPREGLYLLARRSDGARPVYVAVAVGGYFTDVHVIETGADGAGVRAATAAALRRSLETQGHVVAEGLEFAEGTARLIPEAAPAIAEIARLLGEQPTLRLYIVGHTAPGPDLAASRALSEQRAAAVVEALVSQHGIPANRLEAHGLGPLAPVAGGLNEADRRRNQRIVLVTR